MGKPLWPTARADGTVSVGVRIATTSPERADAVRRFVELWSAENTTFVERDLGTPPYIEMGGEGSLEVVFDGWLANRMWRDWMVAVTGGLTRSVEGVEALGFNDRVSERFRPFNQM
jgi:hypothetical protein